MELTRFDPGQSEQCISDLDPGGCRTHGQNSSHQINVVLTGAEVKVFSKSNGKAAPCESKLSAMPSMVIRQYKVGNITM